MQLNINENKRIVLSIIIIIHIATHSGNHNGNIHIVALRSFDGKLVFYAVKLVSITARTPHHQIIQE